MHKIVLALVLMSGLGIANFAQAQDYKLDKAHSSVSFQASHLGLAWVHGRFNKLSGEFTTTAGKESFKLTIDVDSVDTAQPKRDEHLKSPDFFNAKQFPLIQFESSKVTKTAEGYQVTGELSLHGVKKAVTFDLVGGKTAEFPAGVKRTGFTTALSVNRTEFGMDKMTEVIGDAVRVSISFEGTAK